MKKILILAALVFSAYTIFGQDFAIQQLENSPRHHEWAEISYDDRKVHTFVAYPEVSENALAVIVIHENRGLTDWVRSFADQMAEAGYIALAPDLLSGFSEKFQKTSDFPVSDDARSAIYELDPDQVTQDLLAVQQYAQGLDAANGKTAVMGFCWGGSNTFRFATNAQNLEAALVFYGTAPKEQSELARIKTPVYGFYGGNDNRVNATIEATEQMMKAEEKFYEYEIYEGAGHAFMRRGDDPEGDAPNKAARDQAWEKIKSILGN